MRSLSTDLIVIWSTVALNVLTLLSEEFFFIMNCAFAIDRLDCPVVDSRTQRSVDASVREVLKCALAFFNRLDSPVVTLRC